MSWVLLWWLVDWFINLPILIYLIVEVCYCLHQKWSKHPRYKTVLHQFGKKLMEPCLINKQRRKKSRKSKIETRFRVVQPLTRPTSTVEVLSDLIMRITKYIDSLFSYISISTQYSLIKVNFSFGNYTKEWWNLRRRRMDDWLREVIPSLSLNHAIVFDAMARVNSWR